MFRSMLWAIAASASAGQVRSTDQALSNDEIRQQYAANLAKATKEQEEAHERNSAIMARTEGLLTQQEEMMKRHEEMMNREEEIMRRYKEMMNRQEEGLARFEKILGTWESQ